MYKVISILDKFFLKYEEGLGGGGQIRLNMLRLNMFHLQKSKNEALKQNKSNYEGLRKLRASMVAKKCWLSKWYLSSITSAKNILRCLSKWLGATCGKHSTRGNWSKVESSLHINVLQIAAAFFAVKIYAATLSETSIHLRVDNPATLGWINRQNKYS